MDIITLILKSFLVPIAFVILLIPIYLVLSIIGIPFKFLGLKMENFYVEYITKFLSYYIWSIIGCYFSYQFSVLPYNLFLKILYILFYAFYSISALSRVTENQIEELSNERMSGAIQLVLLKGYKFATYSFFVFMFIPNFGNKIYFHFPELIVNLFAK